ncbi:MAG: SpoIIE family protein phosphatase [Cyclobacteriaceae bacterium]
MDSTLNIDIASYELPCDGETKSGDLCFTQYDENSDLLFMAMIDVAGHGQAAFELAEVIRTFFQTVDLFDGLDDIAQTLHEYISGSRGCAGSFCHLNLTSRAIQYVGVGNTRGRIIGETSRHFVNKDGIIGYRMPRLKLQTARISRGDLLILYSDGVKEFFSVDELPDKDQIFHEDVATIAYNIIKKFGKITDDSTCLVVKMK